MTMLDDSEWGQWSNVEIAKRCGVGETLVRDVRGSLREKRSDETTEGTYTTKHCTEATMRVEGGGTGSLPLTMRVRK